MEASTNLRMDIVVRTGVHRDASEPGIARQAHPTGCHPRRTTSAGTPVHENHAYHTKSAAPTSEACKRQRYVRQDNISFDERSHRLATLEVEIFESLGVEGSSFIN